MNKYRLCNIPNVPLSPSTIFPPRTGQYNFIIGSATPVDPKYAEFIVQFEQVPGQSNIAKNFSSVGIDSCSTCAGSNVGLCQRDCCCDISLDHMVR